MIDFRFGPGAIDLLDHTLRVAIHGLPALPRLPGFPGNLAMPAKQDHERVSQSPRNRCDPSHRDDLLSNGFPLPTKSEPIIPDLSSSNHHFPPGWERPIAGLSFLREAGQRDVGYRGFGNAG